jgi:hypothetical protein
LGEERRKLENVFCRRELNNYPIFMCFLEEENLAIA